MSDKKVIRIRKKKDKEENKMHIVRLKKKDTGMHTLRVMSFKKFYDEYMKDINRNPNEYIKSMTIKVLECYYHLKCEFETDKYKAKNIKKILNQFNYNDYLGIYDVCGFSKLKHLGIQEIMTDGVKKLYEVLQFLICKMGNEIYLEFPLDHIRFCLYANSLEKSAGKKVFMDRMFVIQNNTIVESGKDIEPNKLLKGSLVMIETGTNQFVSIPYIQYKRLYQIKQVKLEYSIYDRNLEDVDNDTIDDMLIMNNTFKTNDDTISSLFRLCEQYFQICAGLNELGWSGMGYDYECVESVVLTMKDGSEEKYIFNEFIRRYLPFMDWC